MITVEKKGSKIIITADYEKEGKTSASNKSVVNASTHGNIPVVIDGKQHFLGLNLYQKA